MEIADIGDAELNSPVVVATCLLTLIVIFGFPPAIPEINGGEWELWVSFTLMALPNNTL